MEKWFFPPLSGGNKQGLNNSGVAMFKGIDSLTRETIQTHSESNTVHKLKGVIG